jgi:hypothetical protein
MSEAFHFMVRGREPLKMFRLGSIGNLADSTREVGGAEVDVGSPRFQTWYLRSGAIDPSCGQVSSR